MTKTRAVEVTIPHLLQKDVNKLRLGNLRLLSNISGFCDSAQLLLSQNINASHAHFSVEHRLTRVAFV